MADQSTAASVVASHPPSAVPERGTRCALTFRITHSAPPPRSSDGVRAAAEPALPRCSRARAPRRARASAPRRRRIGPARMSLPPTRSAAGSSSARERSSASAAAASPASARTPATVEPSRPRARTPSSSPPTSNRSALSPANAHTCARSPVEPALARSAPSRQRTFEKPRVGRCSSPIRLSSQRSRVCADGSLSARCDGRRSRVSVSLTRTASSPAVSSVRTRTRATYSPAGSDGGRSSVSQSTATLPAGTDASLLRTHAGATPPPPAPPTPRVSRPHVPSVRARWRRCPSSASRYSAWAPHLLTRRQCSAPTAAAFARVAPDRALAVPDAAVGCSARAAGSTPENTTARPRSGASASTPIWNAMDAPLSAARALTSSSALSPTPRAPSAPFGSAGEVQALSSKTVLLDGGSGARAQCAGGASHMRIGRECGSGKSSSARPFARERSAATSAALARISMGAKLCRSLRASIATTRACGSWASCTRARGARGEPSVWFRTHAGSQRGSGRLGTLRVCGTSHADAGPV